MKKKTVFKKALSAILALMMLFGSLLLVPMTASAADAWDGTSQTKPAGSGTQADPYLISSGAELAYLSLRNDDIFNTSGATVYLTLTNDINMGAKNFTPIDTTVNKAYDDTNGLKTYCSAVVFEGNGYAIRNLKIESEHNHAALFV